MLRGAGTLCLVFMHPCVSLCGLMCVHVCPCVSVYMLDTLQTLKYLDGVKPLITSIFQKVRALVSCRK